MKRLFIIFSLIILGMLTAGNYIKEEQNLSGKENSNFVNNNSNTISETGNFTYLPGDFFNDRIENQKNLQINSEGFLKYGIASGLKVFASDGLAFFTQPRIVSLSPPQNAVNVNKAADIKVIFDQDINSATLNNDNIKVSGMQTGCIMPSLSYNNSIRELTIDPDIDFKAGEYITVILKSGIKNFSGDSLSPYSFGFTIEATQGIADFSPNFLIQDSSLQYMCMGDIDRDGDMDILASFIRHDGEYRAINVYKRNADGYYYETYRFFEQLPRPENTTIQIELNDMDNDGYLDAVILTDGIGNSFKIFYNNGFGQFINPTTIDFIEGYRNYFIFDFDNDGDNDILHENYPIEVVIYSNIGNHQFDRVYLGLNESEDLEFRTCCDFDNDGDIDIINRREILLNNGNLSFSRLLNSAPYGIAGDMKDFDNDGDLDMITSNASQIYLHRNNGNGIFSDSTLISSGDYSYLNIAGDFTADGSFDLLMYDNSVNKNAIFKNNGSGYFTFLSYTDSLAFSPLFSNDIDSDGDIDLIGKKNNFLYALLNEPNNYLPPTVIPENNSVNVNVNPEITVFFRQDMNASTINNSNIKIFSSQSGLINCLISYDALQRKATIDPVENFKPGDKIQVTLSSGIQSSDNTPLKPYTWTFIIQALTGTGVFTMSSIIDTSFFDDRIISIYSADIDSDGDPDLITSGSEILMFKNNGNAEFSLSQTIEIANTEILTGDFDGDGDPDILCISGILLLIKNDGNGNFINSYTSTGGGSNGSSGDIDEDGDLDVVMLSQNKLKYYLNDGSGIFSERSITFTDISGFPIFLLSLNLGDMDNDGDLDFTLMIVQIHGYQYSDLMTLYNDGNANFGNASRLSAYFVNSKAADLDGDKDLDILSNSYLYFNNGIGVFSRVTFPTSTNSDILPADYDADGDIDAVFTDENSDNVKVYKNNSFGTLELFSSYPAGSKPFMGTTADFDLDGDIDLIIANESGDSFESNISILLNDYKPRYSITGNSNILVGSENNIYVSSADSGYWDISNYDNTQASIPPNSAGDTVAVYAGNNPGHFVLYFNAYRESGIDTLLSYHVYVDSPFPVELAAFTSSVSGRNVSLIWTTSAELNNSGFDIERASDIDNNIVWNKAGFVTGNGTSNQPNQYSFTDRNLTTGNYKYRLKQIDFNGSYEYFGLAEEVSIGIPDKYDLSQNYPNPFNPVTTINYDLPADGIVMIKVYDILGRELKTLVNEMKTAGYHKIQFNAADLASGAYFYRMTAGDFTAVKKFVVMK
ncbi:MAG: VCBS repeat-containing protein [Ignavibacteria bacterium]|nr:VCBS repeat-containing protein [Ignavibacteria bacterium]